MITSSSSKNLEILNDRANAAFAEGLQQMFSFKAFPMQQNVVVLLSRSEQRGEPRDLQPKNSRPENLQNYCQLKQGEAWSA